MITISLSLDPVAITTMILINHVASPLQDVKYLRKNLPNIEESVEIPRWNHLDFLWAMDAPSMLYNPIIKTNKTR